MKTQWRDELDKNRTEEEWTLLPGWEDREGGDGLGAARGLWSAIRLTAGVVLGAVWLGALVRALRDGQWAGLTAGTPWLIVAVLAFNLFTRDYPRNAKTGIYLTVSALVFYFQFIGG